MITKESKVKRYCCFYASDYHLEMILLPYIKRNLEKNFFVVTQNNLSDSIKMLLERTNFTDYEKNKILHFDWNNNKVEKLFNKQIDEINIILSGDSNFIKGINEKIKELEIKRMNVIDCYNIDEVKNLSIEIQKNYDDILNIKNGYYLRLLNNLFSLTKCNI